MCRVVSCQFHVAGDYSGGVVIVIAGVITVGVIIEVIDVTSVGVADGNGGGDEKWLPETMT